MDILNVVSYQTVRSTLGMSDTDVDDTVMASLNLQDEVEIDLQGWLPDYTEVIADAWTDHSQADRDAVFLRLKAFIKYYAAALLAEAAPGLLLRRISDGENEAQRFDKVNPQELANRFYVKADELRAAIVEIVNPTVVEQVSLFSVVNSSYDPVTGQ